MAVMVLQVQEYISPSETRRGKEGSTPEGFRGHVALPYLDFGLPASGTMEEYISVF